VRRSGRAGAGGFTLVEMLLALGLLALLVVALIRLLDTSMTIWGRTEAQRDLSEMGSAVLDLVAEDVYALEAGRRGDLVGDWARFDTDRDGAPGALQARLRLVRQATAADLLRARAPVDGGASGPRVTDPRLRGLVEVCYALLPPSRAETDERAVGLLYRGERRVGDDSTSFFDPRFFDAAHRPAPGSLELVTGGVLWFEVWYAAQTSIVHDGWTLGDDLSDCAASWDAFGRGRPDLELSFLNAPAAGMPAADELPLLPRRLRVTLEIERPSELRRRTRLADDVDGELTRLLVADEERLPERGAMILVDEEWMQVGVTGRGSVTVVRAQRGTRAAPHPAGVLIHHGTAMVREIPVPVMREDWDL
jgi:hypothetical protein